MTHFAQAKRVSRKSLEHTPLLIDEPKVNSTLGTTALGCSGSVSIYRPRGKNIYLQLGMVRGYLLDKERRPIKMSVACAFLADNCQGVVTAQLEVALGAPGGLFG